MEVALLGILFAVVFCIYLICKDNKVNPEPRTITVTSISNITQHSTKGNNHMVIVGGAAGVVIALSQITNDDGDDEFDFEIPD